MVNYYRQLIDINQPISENPVRFSNIVLLLKGARKLNGRNIDTGVYEMAEINHQTFSEGLYHSYQYLGLISYLILLEQLGSIFKIKNDLSPETGIFYALKMFSPIKDYEKIQAIVALRHSLVHKFGIATARKPYKKELQHKFACSIERNDAVIRLPKIQWEGDYSDKSDSTTTMIYLIDFAELVEGVFNNIKNELDLGNLESKIEIDELNSRYTMIY